MINSSIKFENKAISGDAIISPQQESTLNASEQTHNQQTVEKQDCTNNKPCHDHVEEKRSQNSVLFRPLEDLIKSKKLKPFHEQLLINLSNLATAYAVSDGADALKLSPYLNLPASFGFMHLANKGAKDLDKLFFTSIVGMGAIALQKAYKLPKWILKTLISSIIFTINNKKINFPMSLYDWSRFKVGKNDLLPLLKKFCKIETVIHSIPNIINPIAHWAEKIFVYENQNNSKYGFALAIYALKVLGLSGGFVTVGNLMHKWLGMGGKGSMEGLTEMLVGACPAELASSTKAILLPDAT